MFLLPPAVPLPFNVGHSGFSLHSAGRPPVRGVAPLEANLGILLQACRGHVCSHSAETQACNPPARGNPVQRSWDTWVGGRAGRHGGSYTQESWVARAQKPSSHGNDAKEGLVSRTEAHQSRGHGPSFMMGIQDPPHITCVTEGKSLSLPEPHSSICKWRIKPAPASRGGVDEMHS